MIDQPDMQNVKEIHIPSTALISAKLTLALSRRV